MSADNVVDIGIDTLKVEGNPAKLYEELAAAQGEFVPIPRMAAGQSGNRHFKYADYSTIMRCVRPALTKHGISVLQPLHSRDGQAVTTTILAGHGAAIISSMSFAPHKDPQEFGKHHTYYRRYQLQSMLGLEGDKDADDLPDVNEQQSSQGFSEPAPKRESKPAPKASESAEKKPAPVKEEKTATSASTSATVTNGKAKTPKPGLDANTVKSLISECMKKHKWRMLELKEFHHENIGEWPQANGVDLNAHELSVEQMRLIHSKLVELKDCAPF